MYNLFFKDTRNGGTKRNLGVCKVIQAAQCRKKNINLNKDNNNNEFEIVQGALIFFGKHILNLNANGFQ